MSSNEKYIGFDPAKSGSDHSVYALPLAEYEKLRALLHSQSEELGVNYALLNDMRAGVGPYFETSKAGRMLARALQFIEDMRLPCTRADYTAAKLDEVIRKLADEAKTDIDQIRQEKEA